MITHNIYDQYAILKEQKKHSICTGLTRTPIKERKSGGQTEEQYNTTQIGRGYSKPKTRHPISKQAAKTKSPY